ncbi:ABC transporter [Microbacterium abyssi]|uniref:ABC transporter n=1 Tax=Microbacterium abyssi TaxID=2782166 RepID=UPI0018871C63|nr:ABC transporter [Microbacterium sp. A18JL241]
MSDPEVPQHEQKSDVDDVVDSANAGLAEAEAARGDAPGRNDRPAGDEVDPDLAAFEAAEQEHPGTFAAPEPREPAASDAPDAFGTDSYGTDANGADSTRADAYGAETPDAVTTDAAADSVFDRHASDPSIADSAYLAPATDDTETRVVPSEPIPSEYDASEPFVPAAVVAAPVSQHQPIFVQAPEPPRERGNRGTAGAIGLLATLAFAILYLGTSLGLGALAGDITGENIGEAALTPLTTWGFWVPVVVFFIGFWLLGAIINRGRWGLWVVFGIIVGLFAYAGHILGQLFEAPFWLLTARQGADLVGGELLAPLAIAAFVFGRELTIWFGAWVARSGARKTELNEEAQREYERTLEAGPTLSR